MIAQIDTVEKKVTLYEDVTFSEIENELSKLLGDGWKEWKLSFYSNSFIFPTYPTYPVYPTYPIYTNTPIVSSSDNTRLGKE